MLAADAELEVRPGAAAELAGDRHQLADSRTVQHLERIVVDDVLLEIERQETAGVIPREPPCRLRQVVRAEREELCLAGDLVGGERGALLADEVATEAEFFSFGTNDLTQMAFGFSRDDVGKFLRIYQDKKILDKDPFASFDGAGTGQLVDIAVKKGRATRKDLKLGICGEHGGDPSSVHFFHNVGLDYVSCSPYRVPVARLAAAQAALSVKVGD